MKEKEVYYCWNCNKYFKKEEYNIGYDNNCDKCRKYFICTLQKHSDGTYDFSEPDEFVLQAKDRKTVKKYLKIMNKLLEMTK